MAQANDFVILLAGEAGQGIQSIESVLLRALKRCAYHVFATSEVMSRVRGGTNSTTLRLGSHRVRALPHQVDLFVAFSAEAVRRYTPRCTAETLLVGDPAVVSGAGAAAPFAALATEAGDKRAASMVAAGVIMGLLGQPLSALIPVVEAHFSAKGEALIATNVAAATAGHRHGQALAKDTARPFALPPATDLSQEILINGSQAIALGALAGDCDAIFSYPMSPGTGVLSALAHFSTQTDLVVEQVEDEIAAINMALGANYAGARAMVTTSGGGFALMTEGISLAGISETPVVVHVAQRPGPGTGLPTRTAQEDLNLVRYAGHGLFARAIFAPATLEEAFALTHQAFNLADALQIPVFILSDQYLVDTTYNVPPLSSEGLANDRHLVAAEPDYQRYQLTPSGLSPRSVPGFGPGRVCVDSDEHDERGRITEDLDGISLQMKDKRFRKFALVQEAALPPIWHGPADAELLLVAWGSTGPAIEEALARLASPKVAHLHFPQVWPIHASAGALLRRAGRRVAVENSQEATFADWLRLETGVSFAPPILKYNGLAFSIEELVSRIEEAL